MSDTDILYMVSLEKHIEKLKHENVELKRMFCDLVFVITNLNEKTVSIINEYKTLIEKDSEQK
jgi:hypothetical protein